MRKTARGITHSNELSVEDSRDPMWAIILHADDIYCWVVRAETEQKAFLKFYHWAVNDPDVSKQRIVDFSVHPVRKVAGDVGNKYGLEEGPA